MPNEMDGGGLTPAFLNKAELRQYSPLVLAWVGDAVFELLVRQRLLDTGLRRVNELHRAAVSLVRAESQAQILMELQEQQILNEEERDIVRRGRNSHSRMPRHASVQEYHYSTGFEALIGWLWLSGERDRLDQIVDLALNCVDRVSAVNSNDEI